MQEENIPSDECKVVVFRGTAQGEQIQQELNSLFSVIHVAFIHEPFGQTGNKKKKGSKHN